jgi:hypothetical protein
MLPVRPRIQWVPETPCLGIKKQESEANHSPPLSTKCVQLYLYSCIRRHFVLQYSVKNRDFTVSVNNMRSLLFFEYLGLYMDPKVGRTPSVREIRSSAASKNLRYCSLYQGFFNCRARHPSGASNVNFEARQNTKKTYMLSCNKYLL